MYVNVSGWNFDSRKNVINTHIDAICRKFFTNDTYLATIHCGL